MPRDPMLNVRVLGNTLLGLPLKERLTVHSIAKKSLLHWNTTSRFLDLIRFAQQMVPLIHIEQTNGTEQIWILSAPAFMKEYPTEVRIMVRMYLLGAVSPLRGVRKENLGLSNEEKVCFDKLIEAKYVGSVQGHFFLETSGVHAIIDDIQEIYSKYGQKKEEEVKSPQIKALQRNTAFCDLSSENPLCKPVASSPFWNLASRRRYQK